MSRPTLRLIDGLRERADNAEMESTVLRDEALAHVRRMRLALQLRLFDEYPFSVVRRTLLADIDKFARKFEDTPERAA